MTRARAVLGALERLRASVCGALVHAFQEGAPEVADGLAPVVESWDAARLARLERAGLLRPRRPAGR